MSNDELKTNISSHLSFLGQNPSDVILDKCVQLCLKYEIDEEYLVDQWSAFTLSKLRNAPISISGLELLERKELVNIEKPPDAEADLFEPFEEPNPKTPKSAPKSPKTINKIKDIPSTPTIIKNTPCTPSTPLSQLLPYSERVSARKVTLNYGDIEKYMPCMEAVEVKQFGDPHDHIPNDMKYMWQSLNKQKSSASELITYIAKCIAQKNNIDLPQHFNRSNFDGEYIYGRVKCDGKGKLNHASVLIELPFGTYSKGEAVPLNVTRLKDLSIFPGQIVVVKGRKLRDTFEVHQLFTDAYTPPSSPILLKEPIQILTACGPYTLKNDLTYEPLQDLLKYVLEVRCHVLILMGPFLEVDNENVVNGEISQTYESFFNALVDTVMEPLAETDIKVVFVASSKDVHHHNVYPTPSYKIRKNYPNLLCVPDPSMISINGVVIGVTTADIIFHIGKQELTWNRNGDRMAQLATHLLQQRCFYPLYPPERGVLPLDYPMLEKYAVMDDMPHVLIIPSTFKQFVKKCEDCTVINPERLVKGYSGGTFAKISITHRNTLNVGCEIIRI